MARQLDVAEAAIEESRQRMRRRFYGAFPWTRALGKCGSQVMVYEALRKLAKRGTLRQDG